MELSYAEFTSDRPVKKGKTVMCVPFAFKIYDKDGRKVAVPTRPKVLSAGISKSGYLMFCDEAEAMECLENLELEFRKNGISNFKDIKKASLLSKDLLRHAGFAKKKNGTFKMIAAIRTQRGLLPMECKSIEDLEHIDWYKTLSFREQHRLNKSERRGIFTSFGEREKISPENPLVSFRLPGTTTEIRTTVSMLREYEKEFGNIQAKSAEQARGITHIKESVHEKRSQADETKG